MHKDDPSFGDQDDLRTKLAMKEARRHYVGEKKNFDKALESIKNAMDFRIEKKVNLLRQIGDVCESAKSGETESVEEVETLKKYRALVEEELSRQPNVIGGFDREDRSITIRWDRKIPGYETEGYFLGMLYVVERSIAATEIRSRGKQEKMTGLLDMGQYDSSNSIPASVYRAHGRTLQRYYPERLAMFYFFDSPLWLRLMFGLIAPFLDPVTRKKIVFLSGSAKHETLDKLVDTEKCLPVLKEDGKIVSDVTTAEFITEVPFHGVHGLED
jgi:CRAL/TRIO domain